MTPSQRQCSKILLLTSFMILRVHIFVQGTVIGTLNECSMFKGCELIEEKQ